MLWAILFAFAIGGGHVLTTIFYSLIALALCRHRQVAVVTIRPASPPPPSAYDNAVARQRVQRLRLV